MEKTGLTETFNGLFLREEGFMEETSQTPPAFQLQNTRKQMLDLVKAVGKNGDLDTILTVERGFLENDLERHANSPGMVSSLTKALTEISAAEAQLGKVRDPQAYKSTNADHSLPRNRIHGLPKDQAHQFFGSHATRLLNLDRSRLAPEEKKLLDQRKTNMRTAVKLYEGLQREALGLAPKGQEKGRKPGLEL